MKLIEHFLRLLAPDECVECGREGSLLCPACAKTCLKSIPERCYRCYRLSEASKTCAPCRRSSVLNSVWISTMYVPTARKIVHALKFNYSRDAAKIIAAELCSTLPDLPAGTILVHVPAATTHVRRRGFDQSALIARELSILLKIPHVHALARYGQQRQVGSTRATRLLQMKGAFRTVSPHVIHGARILLIDDVLTTGSTIEAAGLTLRQSGAKSVSAVCFAQAL